ncbi:MAG: sugar phosphate isomerase/epimerase family protein [Terriglobia bacterium]
MDLKFAISDYTFPKLEWEQALRLGRDIGMEAIDVGLFAGRSHLRPEDLFSRPAESAARVIKALREHDLEIADVFGQPGTVFEEKAPNHPDPDERKKATEFYWRLLEFAARCNAKHMSLLPGVHFEQEKYEDSLKRCADELTWRVEAASRLGIVFAVELHLGSIAPTPSQARRLLELVPGLTLTLDYTHFTFQGIPDAEIEPLLRFTSHFHARGACKNKLQTSSRENTIDYARIIRAMGKMGYAGYVVLEYVWTEWMRCNEVDNLTETILLRDLLRSARRES